MAPEPIPLGFPQGQDKRTTVAVQGGVDGFDLLEALHAAHAPAWLREIPAIVVLPTVWLTQDHRTVTDGRGGGGLAGGQRPPAPQSPDLLPG